MSTSGILFPISRDPPEGGTFGVRETTTFIYEFPISRDPPEGGTPTLGLPLLHLVLSFQFLGIPPKGEHSDEEGAAKSAGNVSNF